MPLTEKGEEIKHALVKEYGEKKGEQVLYAGKNAGTFTGIDDMPVVPGAEYFGAPGAATRISYASGNPGYASTTMIPVAPSVGPAASAFDATLAWGRPYDLSGAPARGPKPTPDILRASGLR